MLHSSSGKLASLLAPSKKPIFCAISHNYIFKLDKNVKKIRSVPFHTYFQSSVILLLTEVIVQLLSVLSPCQSRTILIIKAHLPPCMKFEIIHSVFCKSFLRDIFILC